MDRVDIFFTIPQSERIRAPYPLIPDKVRAHTQKRRNIIKILKHVKVKTCPN
jgi:hypothetical protein